MCGRYALTLPPDLVARWFAVAGTPNWPPRYNIAPTQDIPMVLAAEGGRRFAQARWGLLPFWAKGKGPPLINARIETLATRFRAQFQDRRCLVPADGWYEWQAVGGLKQPFLVRREDRAPIALAGIYEKVRSPDGSTSFSVAIVTRPAAEELASLHGRMPAVVSPEGFSGWLDPGTPEARALALLTERPDAAFEVVRVSRRINDARFEGPLPDEAVESAEPDLPGLALASAKENGA